MQGKAPRLPLPPTHWTECAPLTLFGRPPAPQDHLNGKQYLGWKAIREHYAKLQEKFSALVATAALPGPPPRAESGAAAEEGEAPASRERERSPRWAPCDTQSCCLVQGT